MTQQLQLAQQLASNPELADTDPSLLGQDPTQINSAPLPANEAYEQPVDSTNVPSAPVRTEEEGQEEQEEDVNLLEEASSVIGGGAIDAVESVGGFAELTGDTIKTGLNQLLGKRPDATQNPFDANYIHGDGNWLNVPDQVTDWNGNVIWEDNQPKTAIGKFGRGLVEFGLLTWATGGVGGAALGGARVSTRGIALARSMGVGAKGSRYLKLLGKGAKVGSEGAIADLISTSSEHANIMNLAQDNIPWAVPIIGDMIAVKPEDNPWTARFKSIVAGAGLNYVGHGIGAIYKGFWEAGRARMAGKSVDEANIIGNDAAAKDFETNMRLDEDAHVEMALDDYQQGRGISRSDPLDEYARTYLSPEEYDEWATGITKDRSFEALGKDQPPKLDLTTDTRGKGEFYHGAADEFKLDDSGHFSTDTGIYGQGLYSTDDLTTAGKYQKKNRKTAGTDATRTIYKVEEKTPVNFYDLDQPLDDEVLELLQDAAKYREGYVDEAIELITDFDKKELTFTNLLDKLRERSEDFNVTRSEFQEIVDTFKDSLREKGFGGFTHQGGKLAGKGKRLHQVKIYWDPQDQLNINKVDVGGGGAVPPRVDDLKQIAEARGKEAGDEWVDDFQSNTKRLQEDEARDLSPFVNDGKFTQNERATYRAPENATKQHLAESINSTKAGGDGSSYTPLASESYIRSVARGDVEIRRLFDEVADDITDAAFKDLDNRLPWKDVKQTIVRQANDLLDILLEGGDVGKSFKKALEDPNNKNFRLYADGTGNNIITISPTQKAANVLVLNALAKQVSAVAQGTLVLRPDVPIGRQTEMLYDSMKVLMIENKKMGMMWGLDGKAQQKTLLTPTIERLRKQSLEEIKQQYDEYFKEIKKLEKQERWQELEDLAELHALSGGKVRTLYHIHEYLRAKLRGGRMDGMHIKGRVRKELQGSFFNSVLSSFSTPIKAIAGTNMIAMLRPIQAFMGAGLRGKNREIFMASAQIDNMGKAWAESFQLAKHNWDLGVQRKGQTYQGKFDFDADIKEWKSLKKHYDRYGTANQKAAYSFLDGAVNLNSSPWLKYSANAMGAGDAAARTLIGRQYMRQRAAAKVWDAAQEGKLTSKDLKKVAQNIEEEFRAEIFKQDKDDFWVVSDKGASMAGDYAAMTRALEENFKGLELISNIPGMKAFFPFVRTGFNYLDVTFDHTPLAVFKDKYKDIKQLANSPNPSKILLNKYGLRAQDLQYELAVMEGRMAMGTIVVGLGVTAALSGRITGDMPLDKEDADLWRLNGIKPKSFVLPNGTYVSYEKLEIFNTILSTTANVVGHSDVIGEKRTDEWLKKAVYMTAAVVVDQSMLSGVEDLARLMNPRTSEDLLLQTGSRYVRAHFPYAGLAGQIGDIVDANKREADTFLGLAVQRDALARRINPPKYDILGEDRSGTPLRYGPEQPLWRLFNSLSPIGVYQSEGDRVKEALQAIRFNLPETVGSYQGIALNAKERSELQRVLATSSLRQDLLRVINSRTFNKTLADYRRLNLKESDGYRLNDQRFYAAIAKVFRIHKKRAMRQLLRNNPVLALRVKASEQQRLMGRSGNLSRSQQVNHLLTQLPR